MEPEGLGLEGETLGTWVVPPTLAPPGFPQAMGSREARTWGSGPGTPEPRGLWGRGVSDLLCNLEKTFRGSSSLQGDPLQAQAVEVGCRPQ